jgi:hypothetical protein
MADIIGIFKGGCLYIDWTDEASMLVASLSKTKPKPFELCRLKYEDDMNDRGVEDVCVAMWKATSLLAEAPARSVLRPLPACISPRLMTGKLRNRLTHKLWDDMY